jgi:hypothetical protein
MSGAMRSAAGGLVWFAPCIALILSSLPHLSCSSPHATVADRPPAHIAYHAEKLFVPAGWSAVPDGERSSFPELILTKNDGGAAMMLRELKPAASAKGPLSEEDVCVLGNISMQNKLGADSNDLRILRLPSVTGDEKEFCVYIYSENSLLRRVVVFRAKSKIYEVELRQNSDSLALSSVVDAQMAFVKSLMRAE